MIFMYCVLRENYARDYFGLLMRNRPSKSIACTLIFLDIVRVSQARSQNNFLLNGHVILIFNLHYAGES